MRRAVLVVVLGLAVCGSAVGGADARTASRAAVLHKCQRGSMHVIYKKKHKCLSISVRKRIYWELARWQDTHPCQDERAYVVIAKRFKVPLRAVTKIAVEGSKPPGWPLPPVPPGWTPC